MNGNLEVEEISDKELEERGKQIIASVEYDEGDELKDVMEQAVEWTETNQEFCGKYLSFRSDAGIHDSKFYVFREHKSGEVFGIWGSKVLDGKMQHAKTMKDYKIIYLGKKKTENKSKEYHDFKVIELIGRKA